MFFFFFFFQAEDGIRDYKVTGVQTCALPISSTWSAGRIQSSHKSVTSSAMRPSPKLSWARRASIMGGLLCRGRLSRLLFLLPPPPQLFAVEGGQCTADLPKLSPGLLSFTGGRRVFWRDIQRTALSIQAIGDVQVRAMEALGIATADALGIAATTGGLRQPALDHVFGGPEESLDEPLLPTHH